MKNEILKVSSKSFTMEATFADRIFHLENIVADKKTELTTNQGSTFIFLQKGKMKMISSFSQQDISAGMYAAVSGKWSLALEPNSQIVKISIGDYFCLNHIGGPVEEKGRLKYIDGCSDTLLISPSRLGEPCLNSLHFPSGTSQTFHHHPSFRFGIVLNGEGVSWAGNEKNQLKPGDVFFIPAFMEHRFETIASSLNVIAFHPDTDWGPTDEVHPMINKTLMKKENS